MAIEFDCPYCMATIRVGDDAAGRQGACPKCGTTLVVPLPPAVGQDGVESPPREDLVPDVIPDVVPDVVPDFRSRPEASVSSRVRRRRRKKGSLLFPIACGAGLLLAISFAWVLNDPTRFHGSLSGDLDGAYVAADVLTARVIEAELLDRLLVGGLEGEDGKAYQAMVSSLSERPGRVRSNVMTVGFAASEGRLQVSIQPGDEFRLVRVGLRQSESMRAFVESQSGRLEDLRQEDLAASLSRLLSAWQDTQAVDETFEDWGSYRESVGLAVLVRGIGHHAVARTGRQDLPCLYESDGALYFLVPASLGEFRLAGRIRGDGSTPFPSEFNVRIGPGG